MKGLIIKQPWIDKILTGSKTWELRGRRTRHRGQVGLIESGSGTVVGTTRLVDVVGPLSPRQLLGSRNKHRVPASSLREGGRYRKTFAWVLEHSRRLRKPVPYAHPAGAVIWVNLAAGVARKVRDANGRAPR
ncbi:MAG: ASCH domain-containing protein [Deltaproteobacteria bacterium]|nr:ASCH domain-containing protein [Deltaproteobacteria bacterium]